ncbi:MAG: PH domain-containing protein [Mycobacteriaceae bacterium]|nr:PH domain-containing protein [Mycobacteriaceae bacterium]
MSSDERQARRPPADAAPVVLRISPTAHLASAFGALGLLAVVLAVPWTAPLLVLPVIASVTIVRLRTVADAQTVTARFLVGSRTVDWGDVKGLRFVKGSWARAELTAGGQLRLPAVTFATLPLLAQVSGGRVPNPYGSVAP